MNTEPPTGMKKGRRRPSSEEAAFLILSSASLIAYIGCSLSVRAFISEVARLTGRFLG